MRKRYSTAGNQQSSTLFLLLSSLIGQQYLKIDATCSDAEVRYPTDIDLLNDGTRVLNRYIDKLCTKFDLLHPIPFAKQSRKVFLEVIKRKRKSKRLIKDAKLLVMQ